MVNILADVAPEPAGFGAGLAVVIVLGLFCLAVVAGAVMLIVYLSRRNRPQ
jgi:hypothetical protein